MIGIISRQEWGARVGDLGHVTASMRPQREGIVVHHMPRRTTMLGTSMREEIKKMQIVDHYHHAVLKWAGGFGYSWAIANSGRVYEGRGFRVGAHTGGVNSRFFGVGFFADGDVAGVTDEALQSFYNLAEYLRTYRFLQEDWRPRWHHEFRATSCPGRVLQEQIEAGPPKVYKPTRVGDIVWSSFFRDYLIVTEYTSDSDWRFIRMAELPAGSRARTPLSQMPLVQ